MDEKSTQLAEALLRAFAKFSKNEKKPRHYGVDQLLHPSEIHMVMRVGNNPGAHVSELARIAGITRGAVSQLIARLVKKGLIQKVEDPESSLKTVPVLTNKGKVAFYAHEQRHEESGGQIADYVRNLNDAQFHAILDFLHLIEDMADRMA